MDNGSDRATVPFAAAVVAFKSFVVKAGFSSNLVWVFRRDILGRRRRIWIRVPPPARSEQLARDLFEAARRDGRSLTLSLLCVVGDVSVCYIRSHGDLKGKRPDRMVGLCLNAPASP